MPLPPPITEERSLNAATPISLGFAWTVGGAVLGISALLAVGHYRVGRLEELQAAEVVKLDAGQAVTADLQVRLRVQEAEGRRREEWEKRVEKKLDMLLEGGVRTARGGR